MNNLILGSWPHEQCQILGPSIEWVLSSIKLVGSSNNIYANITLVGMSSRIYRWVRCLLFSYGVYTTFQHLNASYQGWSF